MPVSLCTLEKIIFGQQISFVISISVRLYDSQTKTHNYAYGYVTST